MSQSHNIITFSLSRSFSYVLTNHISKLFQTKLSEILTFLSEFNNANCGISDGIVRFLHSDQNVRNAPDQTN